MGLSRSVKCLTIYGKRAPTHALYPVKGWVNTMALTSGLTASHIYCLKGRTRNLGCT